MKCPKCKKKAYRKIFCSKGDDYFHDPGPIIRRSCFVPIPERAAFFDEITKAFESVGLSKPNYTSTAYIEFIDAWRRGVTSPGLIIKEHLQQRVADIRESIKIKEDRILKVEKYLKEN